MFIKKLFSKNKSSIMKEITITQHDKEINLSGTLDDTNYKIKQLWIIGRNEEDIIKVNNSVTGNNFEFIVPVNNYSFIDGEIYNFHILVGVHESALSETEKTSLKSKSYSFNMDRKNKQYDFTLRLGRFLETNTNNLVPFISNNKKIHVYKTVKGGISLSVDRAVEQNSITQIDYLKMKKNQMRFGGKLFTRTFEIEELSIEILGRVNNVKKVLTVDYNLLEKDTIKKYGLNRYTFKCKLYLDRLFSDQQLNEDIYDFYFRIKYKGIKDSVLVRLGKPRFRAKYKLKTGWGLRGNTAFAVNPYYTIKAFNLSIQVEEFEKETYEYLLQSLRWGFLLRLFNKGKKVWLVGERPYKAQDTGYHFFKYMRENHPEKEVYYVIEKDSPELKNLDGLGNVVYFKSKEHIKTTLIADRIISSHHPDYLYPLRTEEYIKAVKAKKVFIQHGILGTKNIEHFYGKNSPSFNTDLFLVSSDFEKDIVINDFGYNSEEVKVTGLSRFDSLFLKDMEVKKQLLIMPTWREWLVRDDVFLDSEYYERYNELVNSPELLKMSERFNFDIVLCLHPNMQKFSALFQNHRVKVIHQGEVDVQRLMKESIMMITDYSSVAFDFSLLDKPVLYYQFDRKRFIGNKGSHLDLDNDLPGEIVRNSDEIIANIKEYAQSGFKMKGKYQRRASVFLKYKDLKSSERIFKAINNMKVKRKLIDRFIDNRYFKVAFNRFRKSSMYFPSMKVFYRIAKILIPVDNNLILFESGIGKQYADSPRYIYEEIVRRDLPYKKVWVNNVNTRFRDKNTIRIKRLSPSYYYYLAKSGFWVNNQNFPTYIKKDKNTTYLQTWHGTPLKKMLHDIDKIMGRTDDYMERVSHAIENWDYLISPSKYATEKFKSAFNYKKEVLEVGYPRNDVFYLEERDVLTEQVRNRLNIPIDKKIILYAPTFRDNAIKGTNNFQFDLKMDLLEMNKTLSKEYVILIRSHVIIKNNISIDEELKDFVIDVSKYAEMQELLLITDILITDYSSVMFDYANTNKPMLFFTYDLETYRDEVRGFYIDFENEAPGPLVRDTNQLIQAIQDIEEIKIKYNKRYESFKDKYCKLEDGKASERIVDIIFESGNK